MRTVMTTREGGFSLIELMVAIVILMIGLLGLAALQTNATVAEIKHRLQDRIREVEAQLRMNELRKNPASGRPEEQDLTSRIAS